MNPFLHKRTILFLFILLSSCAHRGTSLANQDYRFNSELEGKIAKIEEDSLGKKTIYVYQDVDLSRMPASVNDNESLSLGYEKVKSVLTTEGLLINP